MMKTYVISLSGSPRRRECIRLLEGDGIDFEFFDAFDGRERSVNDRLFRLYDPVANRKRFKRSLSPEEVGCYVSHLQVWKKIAVSGVPAMVLEDDFTFARELKTFVESIPLELIKNSVIKICEAKRQRWTGPTVHHYNGHHVREYRIVSPHTTGYVIGSAAAQSLLDVRSRFSRPVDIDLKHVWEHSVVIYGVDPPLVWEREERKNSTIEIGRHEMKPDKKVRRLISNLIYQAKFRKSSFLYRLSSRNNL